MLDELRGEQHKALRDCQATGSHNFETMSVCLARVVGVHVGEGKRPVPGGVANSEASYVTTGGYWIDQNVIPASPQARLIVETRLEMKPLESDCDNRHDDGRELCAEELREQVPSIGDKRPHSFLPAPAAELPWPGL
jgi:hypothetical protein